MQTMGGLQPVSSPPLCVRWGDGGQLPRGAKI